MDTDCRTMATVKFLAEEAHRVLSNFNAYYTISGYKEAYEISDALEWLENTAYKHERALLQSGITESEIRYYQSRLIERYINQPNDGRHIPDGLVDQTKED